MQYGFVFTDSESTLYIEKIFFFKYIAKLWIGMFKIPLCSVNLGSQSRTGLFQKCKFSLRNVQKETNLHNYFLLCFHFSLSLLGGSQNVAHFRRCIVRNE